MGAIRSSVQTWSQVLALIAAAVMSVGSFAQSARAEGVLGSGAFVSGGLQEDGSLTDALGSTHLEDAAEAAPSRPASSRMAIRPASPDERADAGGDFFRLSRIALPLVLHSTVGEPADAVVIASSVRPMTGTMVGLRPHPRTWGSTLGR